MSSIRDEFERSMSFAEIALGQMKALRQPAIPRNYEVWYTYATGQNAQLNSLVNEALSRNGVISDKDISAIYDQLLSPQRFGDTLEAVGDQVASKISEVLALVKAAAGEANDYTKSLAGASSALAGASELSLTSIVETLMESTRKMEARSRSLQANLDDSQREINELKQNLEAVRTESLTDPLTSLTNRKYFDAAIVRLMAEADATGEPLSLLMTDIDHFKKFNDTYGHLTGDQVLRLVALSVKQNVKGQDVTARYGGEEFAVILPRTNIEQAVTVAEHIRKAVMGKELMKRSTGESLGRITISIGVAPYVAGDTPATLIERADSFLYAAKRAGRNRVVTESDVLPAMVA